MSCVAFLPDGRVLSGGADNKLCLWGRAGSRCIDLLGHTAAISAVAVGGGGGIAVSASYDTTLRGWATGGRDGRGREGAQLACLVGHTAPVLDLAWPSSAAAGAAHLPLIVAVVLLSLQPFSDCSPTAWCYCCVAAAIAVLLLLLLRRRSLLWAWLRLLL